MKKKIRIAEVKELLNAGHKVRVKTLSGEYTEIVDYIDKGLLPAHEVVLANERRIEVTAEHRFFASEGWVRTSELVVGSTRLLCDDGEYHEVSQVSQVGAKQIVDITVKHPEACYYGNGILNHNTGKSYMAVQVAVNAQKKGIDVVYFDSESALDAQFLERSGVNLENFLYIPATSCEFVFDTIDTIIDSTDKQILFIWDSLAFTPCESDLESEKLNPNAGGMLRKPKVIGAGLQKLINPLNAKQHTLMIINQLRINIPKTPAEALVTPYFTPGGKALTYAYTLRIWLTGRKARASFVENDRGERIGSSVSAKIEKSRGGTQGRKAMFKILWGGDRVGIQDEESWLEAVKDSQYIHGTTWKELEYADGTKSKKFQAGSWLKMLTEDKFKERVLEILDQTTQRADEEKSS